MWPLGGKGEDDQNSRAGGIAVDLEGLLRRELHAGFTQEVQPYLISGC